jgi:hypothetical protein
MATRDDGAIRDSLAKIGHALSSSDAQGVAELWDVPGLVLADQGARQVGSREEVREFFETSIRAYREKGTPTAALEVDGIAWISDRIAAVRVDWLAIDAGGARRGREYSYYLMRIGDDGVARIHVAMSRVDV